MADNAPRKTGLYERPMGGKGLMIGIVVLLALIVLAIIFFRVGVREPARSGRAGSIPSLHLSRGERPGGLVQVGAPVHAPMTARTGACDGRVGTPCAAVMLPSRRGVSPCPCLGSAGRPHAVQENPRRRWYPWSRQRWRSPRVWSRPARSA